MWEAAALASDTEHQERAQTGSVVFTALITDAAPSIPWQVPSAWSFAALWATLQHQLVPGKDKPQEQVEGCRGSMRSPWMRLVDSVVTCIYFSEVSFCRDAPARPGYRNASAPGFGWIQFI